MSLWNPSSFSVTGEPLAPPPPPALRVHGAQATAQQLAWAQQKYAQFCAMARVSVVPNPTEQGWLPDGSRYRITVIGNAATMELWTKGAAPGGAFVAWTAFFNIAHMPIWDRPIVDFPYDDLPPRPESPGPAPTYPTLAESYNRTETTGVEPVAPIYQHLTTKIFIGWGLVGAEQTPLIEGSQIDIELVDNEYYEHRYVNFPTPTGYFSLTVRNYQPFGFGEFDGGVAHVPTYGGSVVSIQPSTTSTEGLAAAAAASATAYNASAIASWEASYASWNALYTQWLIDDAAWIEARDELLALNRPWWPVLDVRIPARPQQAADIKAHLMTGIGDRHLTARILSFPYNVAYRTEPAVGSGGSVTHEWVVEDTQRGFRSTLTNAQPYTVYPIFDEPSAGTYPAHILRRDLMPPECLFGWTANGQFSYVNRYYASQRSSENYVVAAPGLEALNIMFPPDYFTATRAIPDTTPGLVVASDVFVPVGSKFTVVLFEYLLGDPRTGELIWTTCPDLMQHDSIWIREGGVYIDTPIVEGMGITQRVRIAGAFEQTRTGRSTWSQAKPVPTIGNWDADFVLQVAPDEPTRAPVAVVIAESLSPPANPSPVQSGGFYLDATHLGTRDRAAIDAAKAAPWVSDGTVAPQQQFIVRALIATGRIAP